MPPDQLPPDQPSPRAGHVIVMGVSGTGKSTVGAALAYRLGWRFGEGDAFHSEANLAKMAAGVPLTDADREPWLAALSQWVREQDDNGHSSVVACSALRRAYRDVLRCGAHEVYFVHLDGPFDVLNARVANRPGHFMPAALLQSQVETLEGFHPDEDGLVLDIRSTREALCAKIVTWLATRSS